jgi:hypothetical protein
VLPGYQWSHLRCNGAQKDAVLAMQAFLTLLLQPVASIDTCRTISTVARGDLQQQLSGQDYESGLPEVLSLPVLMPCIEPFFFCQC